MTIHKIDIQNNMETKYHAFGWLDQKENYYKKIQICQRYTVNKNIFQQIIDIEKYFPKSPTSELSS